MQATPAAAPADRVLLAALQEGQAAAFEELMRRYNRLLFRAARGIVRDDAEAQDVVQEAYLRAFTAMQGYRGDAALSTWLARIAVNAALDARRKRGHVVELDALTDADGENSPEPMMSLRAADTETPDGMAERAQLRGLLQAAIEGLPAIYRSVFILRAVEEMSVDETAFCLRVSDAVVKTRYARARAMLREALGAQVEAEAPHAFAFAGARCDAVVAHVLGELDRRGQIRRH